MKMPNAERAVVEIEKLLGFVSIPAILAASTRHGSSCPPAD